MTLKKRDLVFFSGFLFISLFFIKCRSVESIVISPLGNIPFPKDNVITSEKIELGKKLFFDKRLSLTETISCSSCHIPEFAFTDQKKVSVGIFDRKTERNSPSLLNSAFLKTVMYDAHLSTLEIQVIAPIQEHVEMGMDMLVLIKKLQSIEEYKQAARKIFNRDFDPWVLTRSISAFERSLISNNSKFDQFYYQRNKHALSNSEKRGWNLFSEKLYCIKCHPAPYFTTFLPENNGVYKKGDLDQGRFRISNDPNDIGKFKIPSLRNIELTFPYMHDGRFETLEQIFDHYSKGGQKNDLQNSIITPFEISKSEIADLKAFLFSLTDTTYMKDF